MANLMQCPLPDRYSENITSEETLDRLHENWIARFNRSAVCQQILREEQRIELEKWGISAETDTVLFPVCPLGDFKDLIQIKDNAALIKEGIEMKHCVGSYINEALQMNSYFYKLLAPERATVQLKMILSKASVVQFKLKGNKKPCKASYQYLYELLGCKI